MKQTLVKTFIMLFGACFIFTACFIVFHGDPHYYEELDALARDFDSSPSEKRLRELLNYPADGAYSYFQLALIGESFAKHPEAYGSVCARRMKNDESGPTSHRSTHHTSSLTS
jgi:hypothetical protein